MWCRKIGVNVPVAGFVGKVAYQFLAVPDPNSSPALLQQRFRELTQLEPVRNNLTPEQLSCLSSISINDQDIDRPTVEAILQAILAMSAAGMNPFFADLKGEGMMTVTDADLSYFRLIYSLETSGALTFAEVKANIIGTDYERGGRCQTRPDRLAMIDPQDLDKFLKSEGIARSELGRAMESAAQIDEDASRVAEAVRDIERVEVAYRLFQKVAREHSLSSVGLMTQFPPLLFFIGMPGTAIPTLLRYPEDLWSIDALYIKPPQQLPGALAVAQTPHFTRLRSLRLRGPVEISEEDRLTDDMAMTLGEALAKAPWIEQLRLLNLKGQAITEDVLKALVRKLPSHLTVLSGPSEDYASSSAE